MKPTLVLVPCLLCDDAVWKAQCRELGRQAETQIALHDPLDSLGALADAIVARAPPRFAIAGHSMGGRIALEVARRVPERLLGLALLDTGCEALDPGVTGQQETERRYALLAQARRDGMRAMARNWIPGMIHPSRLDDESLVQPILDMFERRTADELEVQIRALLGRPDATSVLATLTCPSLVLCGREDLASPPARHAEMAEKLGRAGLCVVPECGHMSTLERPEAVSRAMSTWLETIGSLQGRPGL
ncbi:MAG TPA: alpha/beta hydrolase [Steroidobacteraceae bacterium]|nr:alpha/beta hydrolase [Steroidobacteraceae bacterium]